MDIDPNKYLLNEIFVSLQGEGTQVGRPVIFVRFSKCNMSCHFCDTEYNTVWNSFSLEELVQYIQSTFINAVASNEMSIPAVLLTGGEPTLYNLKPLLEVLKALKYWVGMESNGTIDYSEYAHLIDHITVSPKAPKGLAVTFASELRLVTQSFVTMSYMQEIERKIRASNYYLSPMELNGSFESSLKKAYYLLDQSRILCEKRWELSIQTHKLSNVR